MMPDAAPTIQFHHLTKTYAQTPALKNFTITIPPGRTTVLLGPSGCGKSTVLRLIVGLIRPDQGRLFFGDMEILPPALPALRLKMGYVIQEGGLFPHLSAAANVTLMARYLGWSRDRLQARLQVLTTLTRFPAAALKRYPVQLSGGQRQRVSLMRALMLDPDVLLLDEPLGALDPMIRAGLQTDLRDIFQQLEKTVVLVTHDLSEAAYLGDHLILLRAGEIVQQGTLTDLLESPVDAFVTEFVKAQRLPFPGLSRSSNLETESDYKLDI
jgi:osmoprotectant transport system ATP-binding protein